MGAVVIAQGPFNPCQDQIKLLVVNYLSMKINGAPWVLMYFTAAILNFLDVVAVHIVERDVQHGQNIFEVIIRQVAASNHQVDVAKTLLNARIIYSREFYIAEA
jgi:hypothetical protein